MNEFCLDLHPVRDASTIGGIAKAHPVRDASLGRKMPSPKTHPVRDASLTGCKDVSSWNFLPSDTFLRNVCREARYILAQRQHTVGFGRKRNVFIINDIFFIIEYGIGEVARVHPVRDASLGKKMSFPKTHPVRDASPIGGVERAHPVRDASRGRKMSPPKTHPVRDASLTGCNDVSSWDFLPSDTFLRNVCREARYISAQRRCFGFKMRTIPICALKRQHENLFRPFRAWMDWGAYSVGRCPTLNDDGLSALVYGNGLGEMRKYYKSDNVIGKVR